ncbi:MAG: DUF167 domain-containing protein [Proteobacteria bacterium]|nr:DUF167 domain-containing protein [Pseudomonadota bacterium]
MRLHIRVTPQASRTGLAGIAVDPVGRHFLKVTVTTPAEGGRANAAAIRLLSKIWKFPKSAARIASGSTGRRKTLEIAGDPDDLAAVINRTLEQSSHD